jgi:hypothetical protein
MYYINLYHTLLYIIISYFINYWNGIDLRVGTHENQRFMEAPHLSTTRANNANRIRAIRAMGRPGVPWPKKMG